jgi:hypothetical protein
MPRDFQINGETLVKVKGAVNTGIEDLSELGLAVNEVKVTPTYVHKDMIVDDFGPDVPPDVMFMIAFITVTMTLVHYDDDALETCVQLAMGNHVDSDLNPVVEEGELVGMGTPLGKGKPLFAEGNCLIELTLTSPQLEKPWRFPAAYLVGEVKDEPLGVRAKQVPLRWRCIPYRTLDDGELVSQGTRLWYRSLGEE